MVDRDKIIVMTKLAIYDKHEGERDKRISQYFRSDYIYRYNAMNRICAVLGCLIVILLHWLHKIFVVGIDFFSLDFKGIGIKTGTYILLVLVFYTIIGSAKAAMEYSACQKRIRRYYKLMEHLDRIRRQSSRNFEEASHLYYGADFTNERDDD